MINIIKLLNTFNYIYTLPAAKKLLSTRWAKFNKVSNIPATGFCYIAAEASYHILKELNPKPICASYIENGERCTHWWLLTEKYGIVDPTEKQYTDAGCFPPYHLGKGKGFLTKQPSKRAQKLIQLVEQNYR